MKKLLDNPKFAKVVSLYVQACASSRHYDKLAAQALEQYGSHGAQISGCVREHFPEKVKDELRALARNINFYSDKAWTARPKHTREDTIRAIGRAVARRDGSGFYGPQG